MLLSANVGFLAIQSIDTGKPNRSAAQIASYISAILSLFIYIICQILTRHHRHHTYGQADKAVCLLATCSYSTEYLHVLVCRSSTSLKEKIG